MKKMQCGIDTAISLTAEERARLEAYCDLLPIDAESDVITLHASTKPGNERMINEERLARMKEGAIFINTARGQLVDYDALEAALRSGRLYGAGLDVFPEEPPKGLGIAALPNVVCTPHYAFYTDHTLAMMNEALIVNVINYFRNREQDGEADA